MTSRDQVQELLSTFWSSLTASGKMPKAIPYTIIRPYGSASVESAMSHPSLDDMV